MFLVLTISVINRSATCNFLHQTSGLRAGVCACSHMHQMGKTVTPLILVNKDI